VTRLVEAAGLEVVDVHGVRLFSDLVPSALVDSEADRAALLALEQAASRHPDYGFLGQLGAAAHVLARNAHSHNAHSKAHPDQGTTHA
jgi:hypothetical protein